MRAPLQLVSSGLAFALVASSAVAQQRIPIRTLTAPVATDSGIFRAVTSIRALSDGRVIVNDGFRRRVVMFDSTLRSFTTLADTAATAPNRYPSQRQAGIFPFLGDSTIFVDTEAQALVVIEPSGKFGRVMAPPKPSDISWLAASVYGTPGFDPKGRLIYRGIRRDAGPGVSSADIAADGANRPVVMKGKPDSAPIVRADFDTRTVDTIAFMRLPTEKSMLISPRAGMTAMYSAFNPLPLTDEWALLPDGTIAIVRASDYHIDWWLPDGTRSSSPKIPFDWKRITVEERQTLLDSVKKADSVRRAALPPPPPPQPGVVRMPPMPFLTVDAEDMWDFYPPVRPGQVKVDREGNIWILPSTSSAAGAGLVFDVVNRSGALVERVQLPSGRNLIGFGPGQTVYMIYAPSPQRILLERAQVVRQGT
jgi:hypothetical protein